MGTLGSMVYTNATEFQLVDASTLSTVFTGTPSLRKNAGDAGEGVYNENLSMENLYLMDFSAFTTPGSYYLVSYPPY